LAAKRHEDLAQIADLVHGAAIRLLRFVRREDVAAGLSAPQLSALSVLVFGGSHTMSALATVEQVRPPTMSRLVDDLEHLGLVERAAKPGDRRVYMVCVTNAGRTLLEEGRRKRLARLVRVLVGATQQELGALRSAAQTIVRLTDSSMPSTPEVEDKGKTASLRRTARAAAKLGGLAAATTSKSRRH
jgi:DNA-binding MarR family transcriptional regulator